MRTNIVIDPELLDTAMRAGHFKTKKQAVEAGLRLLARQAAYREILKWEGKLHWDGASAPVPLSTDETGSDAAVLAPEPGSAERRRGRR